MHASNAQALGWLGIHEAADTPSLQRRAEAEGAACTCCMRQKGLDESTPCSGCDPAPTGKRQGDD